MRSFGNRDLDAFPQKHPDWNFQSSPAGVHDADCPVPPLRFAKDLQGSPTKRVKGVEDLNIRIVRAQGIVGVGVITRMFTSCPGRRDRAGRRRLDRLPAGIFPSSPGLVEPVSGIVPTLSGEGVRRRRTELLLGVPPPA